MKTIEEKAKAYDEAIRKAKITLGCCDSASITTKHTIYDIFPELAESEDERIRNWLIGYFHQYKEDGMEEYANGLKVESIIAWLEKQGEQKPIIDVPSREMVLNVWELGNHWMDITKGVCNTEHGTQLDFIVKHWKEGEHYLKEKQGEKQSGNPYSGVSFKYNGHTWGMCARDGGVEILVDGEIKEKVFLDNKPQGKSALEAITEVHNANANKIESKFKVGDWVIDTHGRVNQVTSVTDDGYAFCLYDGTYVNGCWKDYYHLWTIQDARDGDVLLFEGYYNSIVLFQGIGINGKGRINYHCKCDLGNYSFGVQGDVACLGTIEKDAEHYHPATKEQRELLFQKMKEEGYEWDDEKKELKKIEQRSAWIEDDEEMLRSIIATCELAEQDRDSRPARHLLEMQLNWLKSLKDRLTSHIFTNHISTLPH